MKKIEFWFLKDYICKSYANEKSGYISNECNRLIFSVGVAGFEPATPCSQSIFPILSVLHLYLETEIN